MGMAHWIDNADSYICPLCGYETNNPNRFHGKCPICGFMDVKDIRSADMVEVVRCKDCEHYDTDRKLMPYCKCPKGLREPSDDRFCSFGERRTE